MSQIFEPNLSILPESQRRLWPELSVLPPSFVLCGGTAIALQLGHRSSIDFDFVGNEGFDPDALYGKLPFLNGSKQIQKSANTLTCVVSRDGPVQVSFFGTPGLRLIEPPLRTSDIGLQVASLTDLAGMKAAVVQKRAEARDYIDMDAIIHQGRIDLPAALAAARRLYGKSYNPILTLKSLSFFQDGDLPTLPRMLQDRLAAAIAAVDVSKLPES